MKLLVYRKDDITSTIPGKGVVYLTSERLSDKETKSNTGKGFVRKRGAFRIQRHYGENQITVKCESRKELALEIGDYVFGNNNVKYFMNNLPIINKISSRSYEYQLIFESIYYDLAKVLYLNGDDSEFHLVGTGQTFIDLIITNMERVYPGVWTAGTIDQSDAGDHLLYFNSDNCRTAIQKIAVELNAEIYFIKNTINMTDTAGSALGISLSYGRDNGLRGLTRTLQSDKNLTTRLYAFGSKRNIDINYRSAEPRLIFAARTVEKNLSTFGVFEAVRFYDNIFPQREGILTDVTSATVVADTDIPFDVNDQLIPGTAVKMHFNSGNLSGYEFDLATFNTTGSIFLIKQKTDQQNLTLPNTDPAFLPAVGDKYVLLDITMPQSFIDTAEAALLSEATSFINDNSVPKVRYNVSTDPRYFERNDIRLNVGDKFTIVDTDLKILVEVRILSLRQNMVDEWDYELELSNFIDVKLDAQLQSAQDALKTRDQINSKSWAGQSIDFKNAFATDSWMTTQTLYDRLIGTDGKIKDEFIP